MIAPSCGTITRSAIMLPRGVNRPRFAPGAATWQVITVMYVATAATSTVTATAGKYRQVSQAGNAPLFQEWGFSLPRPQYPLRPEQIVFGIDADSVVGRFADVDGYTVLQEPELLQSLAAFQF